MTGSVATLTPIPRITIRASHRTEVSISGNTAHSTARHDLKVMKASNTTAVYTRTSIRMLDRLTTMLVAASMPELPAAWMNFTFAVSYFEANPSMVWTTESSVSAL